MKNIILIYTKPTQKRTLRLKRVNHLLNFMAMGYALLKGYYNCRNYNAAYNKLTRHSIFWLVQRFYYASTPRLFRHKDAITRNLIRRTCALWTLHAHLFLRYKSLVCVLSRFDLLFSFIRKSWFNKHFVKSCLFYCCTQRKHFMVIGLGVEVDIWGAICTDWTICAWTVLSY
jgi:hypothetical protein